MRKVNMFTKPRHFKMEGTPTLKDLWDRYDYAITFDLKETYNHVPVHSSMRPLLGVAWKGKCYQYIGMPFGLNDAPRVFSMIMRKVPTAIREYWNIKTVVYLDDSILLHSDPEHLKKVGEEVTLFLQWLGWTMNLEKSHLQPTRTFRYLGWEWNSSNLTVCLTKERRQKALNLLREARKAAYSNRWMTNRKLAAVIGVLSATRLQIPMASLHLIKLNSLKTQAVKKYGWSGKTQLNQSILGELKTWTNYIKKNTPHVLAKPILPQAVLTTDAAPSGWGATLFFNPSGVSTIGLTAHQSTSHT
jgi:hypothetical protein